MKKHILAYDYMPIKPLLASLCGSRSICERMLMTWRIKGRWLGKDPKVLLEVIKEHFNGNKFLECQAFWNPKREWETLVICPNSKCSRFFWTFFRAQKCEKLFQHWDSDTNYYKFPCSECSTVINVKAHVESKSKAFILTKFFLGLKKIILLGGFQLYI